jgi:hypothetical protein
LAQQALAEMKRAEHDALPFGVRGELAAPRAEPPPAPPAPFLIPAPDWEAELAERGEPVPPPEPDRAAMFDGYDPPAPTLGPVERLEPLTRPSFPAPNWRQEEEDRARQAAIARREAELDPVHERYPAKKKPKQWRTSW